MGPRAWFKVETVAVLAPDFMRLRPELRGHWLTLRARCALEMNGGVFRGARAWSRREWNLIGLELRVVERLVEVGLAKWEGEDLQVAHFDHEAEQAFRTRSERNRGRANQRWDGPRHADGGAGDNPSRGARGSAGTRATRRPDQRRTEEIPPEPPISPWPPKESAHDHGVSVPDFVNTLAESKQFSGTNGKGNR
jgi:hypothetical protein